MGGGPEDGNVASPWLEPSGASSGVPSDSLATDSVAHGTSKMPVMTEPDSASSQSPRPDENNAGGTESQEENTKADDAEDETTTVTDREKDSTSAVGIESHEENTEADDAEDETATVTGRENDPGNDVASEVQTVKADNEDLPPNPPPTLKTRGTRLIILSSMILQPVTRPISQEQLVAEVKGIYAGLVMVESKCIEVDNAQMPPTGISLDIIRFLEKIPHAKLVLLQDGEMQPHETVRTWFIKAQKDAAEGDEKPSTLEATEDLPATPEDLPATPGDLSTTSGDQSTTPEEASAHPHVSEKSTPQVPSLEDYLFAFQVALESRAKELGWPEYEELAALTTAEVGEEGREKVIDRKDLLDIGYDLVDKLLRDLETAAEKKAAKEKAKEATEAKAKEASQAKEDKKDSDPDPEARPTRVGETPDDPEAQSRPSSGTQRAAPNETSLEEVEAAPEKEEVATADAAPEKMAPTEAEAEESFEEIAPEEAEVASKEAAPEEIAPEEAEPALEKVDPEEISPKLADADADADEYAALDEAAVTHQRSDSDTNLFPQEPQASPVEADADADTALEEVAPEEAATTQQRSDQDANLSAQEPQASPEEAGVAAEDSGKDMADTAVSIVAHTKKTEPKSKKKPSYAKPNIVDLRPLHDRNRYRKIGKEYWVLIDGRFVISLNGEQFHALIELHRTLLHEHHDFFLASQHPSASPALRSLAAKYAMPARMWRHGIHSFLEVLRKRLPESLEFMNAFVILAYSMFSLLDETVPRFDETWIECKADLGRYGMITLDENMEAEQRWRDISKGEYTRVLDKCSTIGRLYHHLAILARPQSRSEPDAYFDAIVSQLFYFTKALVVETPFFAARESMLTVIDPIVAQNKEAEKPDSVPQTDRDNFLTAVAHLTLASLEPELLEKNGHKTSKEHHLQTVYAALKKIGSPACPAEQAEISRIRPSPQLGLLLCQLMLGIPGAAERWSPMMAAWAPDLVTAADRADLAASMDNARDIHDATIEMIDIMIPYLLKDADTRDLRVWGFIYVILVFMRSLKTRPDLLKWFGSAFHAELLAPFVNMLLREDETRGGRALESASQSEPVTMCSLLNQEEKLGDYGITTEDNIRRYYHAQEERRKAEGARSTATAEDATATAEEAMVTPEETTTSDAAHERDRHTKAPDLKRMYANVLPEHDLLRGLFFAGEAGPCDKSLADSTKDAVVVACPPAPEATPAAVQTTGEPAVEQAQEETLTDSDSESDAEEEERTERQAKEAPLAEEERKSREAEETRAAEVRRQEGRLRSPPLFPEKWFANAKYDPEESLVRLHRVQDAESCDDRSFQIVRLVGQLTDVFFTSEINKEGRLWISVPGAPSVPQPDPNMKMPEVVEYAGGVRAVYVHPSFHDAEIEREKRRRAREEEAKQKEEDRKKEKERQKEEHAKVTTDVTTDVATAVDGKAEGDAEERPAQSERLINHVDAEEAPEAVNVPAGAPGMASEDEDDQPISAYLLTLAKIADSAEATTPAEKPISEGRPSSTYEAEHTQGEDTGEDTEGEGEDAEAEHTEGGENEAEHTKAEVETTLPVQGVDDPQDTKGSDAGPDAAAITAPADGPAADPQASVQLTKGALDTVPGMKDPNKAIKRWLPRKKGDGTEEEVEDEDDWTHVSDESHEAAQTTQTAPTAQADGRSVISRLLFRW